MGIGHYDIRSLRAFVTVAETGSVTKAARRIGRTQPAITMQIRRLEELIGKYLFEPNARRPVLTTEGEIFVRHARSIVKMHDELWTRTQTPDVAGRVVLGTPDLYAAYLLPRILASFRQVYPRTEVDVHCAPSRDLIVALDAKKIDLALVTAMPGIRAGEFIRKEQLVWVCGEGHSTYDEDPVPLALLPPGNIYRDVALEALDRIGRPWRLAYISESIGGLQAAVFAGLAISVVAASARVSGMRVVGRQESFPELPEVDLVLHRSPDRENPSATCLADFVKSNLISESVSPKR
jgi:DNA-binding transcriptional LysR family regulator